jgi:GNAT superfamily N-acetyltransferase
MTTADFELRKATADDAVAVHRLLLDIEWISNSIRNDAGTAKIRIQCEKGEVWVIGFEGKIISTMFLTLDSLRDSLGQKVLSIPILTTAQQHRRKGYARLLVRQAKDVATKIGGTIEAYPKNNNGSIPLLRTEDFKIVHDKQDNDGNDLFRWSS